MNGSITLKVLKTHTLKEETCIQSQLKSTMENTNIPLLNLSHAKTTVHMASSLSEPKCRMVRVHGQHFGFYLEMLNPSMEDGQHADKLVSIKVSRAIRKLTGQSTSEAQEVIITLHQITIQESMISRTGILTQLIGNQIRFVGLLMLRL